MENNTTTNTIVAPEFIPGLFELATRQKFYFPYKGQSSVYDMWDLSLKDLDTVYQALHTELQQATKVSLMTEKSDKAAVLEAKIDIIKHIYAVKTAEADERKQAAAKRAEARQLDQLIANKQNAELMNKPLNELLAMRAALDV